MQFCSGRLAYRTDARRNIRVEYEGLVADMLAAHAACCRLIGSLRNELSTPETEVRKTSNALRSFNASLALS